MSKQKISVASLSPALKEGFLTKCGGSIKTWKRRWFVLKFDSLYYFKSPKDTDVTGIIKLETSSQAVEELNHKKKNCFSISTPGRTFYMYSEHETAMREWIGAVKDVIEVLRNKSQGGGAAKSAPAATPQPKAETPAAAPASSAAASTATPSTGASSGGATAGGAANGETTVRRRIISAKNTIPFLLEDDSKVLEFWQIWNESIPKYEDLAPGMAVDFMLSTSANMQKLTWRTSGPQNVFIQRMVDFFWNVGAPESEIDRLNDVGALINPLRIGSWIDMSKKGGMDGGWFFPVDIPIKLALEAADPGDPAKKVAQWAADNNVERGFTVGRDMGAAPPRQTEIRIQLPGKEWSENLAMALDASETFGFPLPPDGALAVLRECNAASLSLSIITSSEGFVRLGIMAPSPTNQAVQDLCGVVGANYDQLRALQDAMESSGPETVEYQYLKEGFGYGVYKEGFDVVFHFAIGEEVCD